MRRAHALPFLLGLAACGAELDGDEREVEQAVTGADAQTHRLTIATGRTGSINVELAPYPAIAGNPGSRWTCSGGGGLRWSASGPGVTPDGAGGYVVAPTFTVNEADPTGDVGPISLAVLDLTITAPAVTSPVRLSLSCTLNNPQRWADDFRPVRPWQLTFDVDVTVPAAPPPPPPPAAAPAGTLRPITGSYVEGQVFDTVFDWSVAAAGGASYAVTTSSSEVTIVSGGTGALPAGASTSTTRFRVASPLAVGSTVDLLFRGTNSAGGNASSVVTVRILIKPRGRLLVEGGSGVQTVDLGAVMRGATARRSITVSNGGRPGSARLVADLALPAGDFRFGAASSCARGTAAGVYRADLALGTSCTLVVEMVPSRVGAVPQVDLQITVVSGEPWTGAVHLTGSGTPAPRLSLGPTIDFGLGQLGYEHYRTIEVQNLGDPGSDLDVTFTLADPNFRILSGARADRLKAGTSKHNLVLGFLADASRRFGARLRVTSNDPSAPATIQLSGENQSVRVWYDTFIPFPEVGCYSGDNRSFSGDPLASYRTQVEIVYDFGFRRVIAANRRTGQTHLTSCSGAVPPVILATAQEDPACMQVGALSRVGDRYTRVSAVTSCANPLGPPGTPPIDAELFFYFDHVTRSVQVTGAHDGFPAHEIWAEPVGSGAPAPLWRFMPTGSPLELFPPLDVSLPQLLLLVDTTPVFDFPR